MRLLDVVRSFTPDQGVFKPAPNEWSIAENLEHLVLAEQGAVNRVWSAADAVRAGRPVWAGEPVRRCWRPSRPGFGISIPRT